MGLQSKAVVSREWDSLPWCSGRYSVAIVREALSPIACIIRIWGILRIHTCFLTSVFNYRSTYGDLYIWYSNLSMLKCVKKFDGIAKVTLSPFIETRICSVSKDQFVVWQVLDLSGLNYCQKNLCNYCYLKFISTYAYPCVWMSTCMQTPMELELQVAASPLMWVLEAIIQSSAKATSVLNRWAISPAPDLCS